jgi:hypothetical protein
MVKLILDGKSLATYEFQQDYYFMMGDNRDNSLGLALLGLCS